MKAWRPEPHLRQKRTIDLSRTDKELFQEMELGDLWQDAQLVECYRYLRSKKGYAVPLSWQAVFEDLDAEISKAYSQQTAPEPVC